MKIIVTTSARSVGCTFVDWTINYLSGANVYYHFESQESIRLTDNPLSSDTAHGHLKNHPVGPDALDHMIRQIANLPQKNSLYTFYPVTHEVIFWCKHFNLDVKNMSDSDWNKVFAAQTKELQGIANRCQRAGCYLIHIDESSSSASYFVTPRVIPSWWREQEPDAISDESMQYEMFFQYHNKKMRVWDLREMMALDMRPLQPSLHGEYVNRTTPHFRLTTNDLWYDGEYAILELMRWLELQPNADRWVNWRPVYHRWQQQQLQHARFTWRLFEIVDAVVNGYYLPLGKMPLPQEAAIQHCLIYAHNLNIETWGLERFPANAQDLHKILETNTHQVDTAYRDVLRTSIDSLRSSM